MHLHRQLLRADGGSSRGSAHRRRKRRAGRVHMARGGVLEQWRGVGLVGTRRAVSHCVHIAVCWLQVYSVWCRPDVHSSWAHGVGGRSCAVGCECFLRHCTGVPHTLLGWSLAVMHVLFCWERMVLRTLARWCWLVGTCCVV